MATNSKKAVKAVDAPQDAAVVVKRTRKSAMPTAQFQDKQASLKANQGKAPVAKKAPAKKATVTPIEQGKVVKGVPAALVEKPAKKVAAKKSVASKSKPADSSSATQPQSNSTQSDASSEPINAKEAQAKANDFNEKVADGELPEGLYATTATIEPMDICTKLVKASNRVPEGMLRFPPEERDRIAPFLTFFERFWVAIPAYFKMEHSFNSKDFSALQKQPEFTSLVPVNSYARFEFSCGSRAIVLRSLVGCATFFFAENEFVDMLKKMPGAVPSIIKEQAEKNKPALTLMTGIPNGFMALVREFETETRLSLATLHRIFGDPVQLLMKVPQNTLARNVQELKLLLDVAPSAV